MKKQLKCPNCMSDLTRETEWEDNEALYHCQECLCDWKVKKDNNEHKKIVSRHFWG